MNTTVLGYAGAYFVSSLAGVAAGCAIANQAKKLEEKKLKDSLAVQLWPSLAPTIVPRILNR
jgi:hypothetical protein